MRYCAYCGKQIREYIKYCPYCGHKIDFGEDLSQRVETPKVEAKPVSSDIKPKETVKIEPKPVHQKVNSVKKTSTSKKLNTTRLTNVLVQIYAITFLIIGIILYAIYINAQSWLKDVMQSNGALSYLQNTFALLQSLPGILSGLVLFAMIIIGLCIYNLVKNPKGKVHYFYIAGSILSIYGIYQFHDLLDFIQNASDAISGSSDLDGLMNTDFVNLLSSFKGVAAHASSYNSAFIMIIIVAIALLVVSILSKLQSQKKFKISSLLSMDGRGFKTHPHVHNDEHEEKIPFYKHASLWMIIAALTFGGLTAFNYQSFSLTKIDVLKNVKLEYDGINGRATARIDNDITYTGKDQSVKSFLNNDLTYYLSKNSNISNGDTITVSVKYNADKAKKLNLDLKDTAKDITVSGVEERFENASQISSDLASTLYSDARSAVESTYHDNDLESFEINDVDAWLVKTDSDYFQDAYVGCFKIHETMTEDDGTTSEFDFYAHAEIYPLTSSYNSEKAHWTVGMFDRENMSEDQLRYRVANEFDAYTDQAEKIS